jgi:hypothetical protein
VGFKSELDIRISTFEASGTTLTPPRAGGMDFDFQERSFRA